MSYRSKISKESYECDLMFSSKVFVYGTLKKGYWNSSLFESAGTFLKSCATDNRFLLLDAGFPYMTPSHSVTSTAPLFKVRGEVWDIGNARTFLSLDILEGHPDHYYRSVIQVEGELMWTYLMPHDLTDHILPCAINLEGEYEWSAD